jgi:hypothetical protein
VAVRREDARHGVDDAGLVRAGQGEDVIICHFGKGDIWGISGVEQRLGLPD